MNNISINPINNSSIFINWLYQQNIQCIVDYKIIVNDFNGSPSQYNSTGNNITLYDLEVGTNYSFIIIPIDTIGREGPPSSLIQYIWNGKNYTHSLIVFLIVPAQVVNISWYQISTDSITIWWNNIQVC